MDNRLNLMMMMMMNSLIKNFVYLINMMMGMNLLNLILIFCLCIIGFQKAILDGNFSQNIFMKYLSSNKLYFIENKNVIILSYASQVS